MSIYTCRECNDAAYQKLANELEQFFPLTDKEVEYLVKNIQHEYLAKETYYFASDLFKRMELFLQSRQTNELARRNDKRI